LLTINRLID